MWCEVVVRGHPGPSLERSLAGFEKTLSEGTTTYVGTVADQAAFEGVLAQVEAHGVALIRARRLDDAC